MNRLNQSRKKTIKIKPARDDILRARYFAKIAGVPANRIIVVDESAANERTLDRRWGWSLKGTSCRVRQPGKRSERWSILPAIGINGYLDYDIFQGSINTDRFTFFIRQLLRKMNKRPGPRSMLVMDNFGTHLPPDLEQMCEEAEVDLVYLPPYSPDLSPIEESFNGLKQWMRRNRALSLSFEGMFEGFFHLAVKLAVTTEDARGYFRSAGISVTEEDQDIDYNELEV